MKYKIKQIGIKYTRAMLYAVKWAVAKIRNCNDSLSVAQMWYKTPIKEHRVWIELT